MVSTKLVALLVLCMAAGAMAQADPAAQKLIAACGVRGALAVKASGVACQKAIAPATVKACPAPCAKLLAGVPKTPACAGALKSMTPAAINAKVGKVSLGSEVRVPRCPSVHPETTGQPPPFCARAALQGLGLAPFLDFLPAHPLLVPLSRLPTDTHTSPPRPT